MKTNNTLEYVLRNKKEMLPHTFTAVILMGLLMLPLPQKGIIALVYLPFFFIFGFRAFSKAEEDGLSLFHIMLIVIFIPFIIGIFFFLILLSLELFLGINPYVALIT